MVKVLLIGIMKVINIIMAIVLRYNVMCIYFLHKMLKTLLRHHAVVLSRLIVIMFYIIIMFNFRLYLLRDISYNYKI